MENSGGFGFLLFTFKTKLYNIHRLICALGGKTSREGYEEMPWSEGLYWCTCRKLLASREGEKGGKIVNGQEIDTVTRLPMEGVREAERKRGREAEGKIDG